MIPELGRFLRARKALIGVYGVEDFPQLGFPAPPASAQSPDLVLAAAPDYTFSNESEGNFVTQVAEGGSHDYLNTDPKMQAIFMAWGAGIPKGVRLHSTSNLDVAPTIAALFGLEMKRARGQQFGRLQDTILANESPELSGSLTKLGKGFALDIPLGSAARNARRKVRSYALGISLHRSLP